MTRCHECGADVPSSYQHCDECGKPIAKPCPDCRHPNRAKARFCGGCGRALGVLPPAVEAAAVAAPIAEPHLPPSIADRFRGIDINEGERKVVTILFADVRGSTELIRELDPEDAMALLEPALAVMVDAVREYGGTVNRVQGDGIMALFGAPIAHEDHAERACLAAWQMLRVIPKAAQGKFAIRIGINSGQVLVKRHLNDMTFDYDAVGAPAHVAHRLEQTASPNTAYVAAQTFRLTSGSIAAKPLGKLELRALSEPVEAFELIGPSGRSDRWQARSFGRTLSPFVGRDAEMSLLLQAHGRSMTGRGQIIMIVGDAGTGKSRLLHEFLRQSQGNATVIRSGATSFDCDRPFSSVISLVRSCLAVVDRDAPPERAIVKLAESVGADAERLGPPLLFVLERPVNDPGWAALDPEARRQRIAGAVKDVVLAAASAAPLLVVIEDVHWADTESQVVFENVMRSIRASPILLLATTRPEGLPQALRSHATTIEMQPLDAESSDAMLRRMIGDGSELDDLRRMIIERTEGTPLFIEETLQMLFDAGALVQQTSVQLARPISELKIPDSVQAVIAARIDTLRSESRAVLQIASVIGKDVPRDLLSLVSQKPALELDQLVTELLRLEFLFEANLVSGRGYTFKHALIQNVAYETMLGRRRRQLHADILTTIEREYPNRLDELAERLGEHAEKGAIPEKAVMYLTAAGKRANTMGAHLAAIALFDRALVALNPLSPTEENAVRGIDARLGLRVALASTADLPRILRCLEEADELARAISDKQRMAMISISQCNILVLLGDIERALVVGHTGLNAAAALDDAGLRINARFALGQAYSFSGDLVGAIDVLNDGLDDLDIERASGNSGTTGTPAVLYLCCLANAHALMGNFEQGHRRSDEALQIAARTARRYDSSYANLSKGLTLLSQGDPEVAVTHLAEAYRVCREAGIAVLKPSIVRFFGLAMARVNRADSAVPLLREAWEQASAHKMGAFAAWCRASLAEAELHAKDPVAAVSTATGALDDARRLALRPVEVHAMRVLAEAMQAAGHRPAVEIGLLLDAAMERADKIKIAPESVATRIALARFHARHGDADTAVRHGEDADRMALDLGMTGSRRRADDLAAE